MSLRLLSIDDWKNVAAAVQSIVTAGSLVIGGLWVYFKYIRQQEKYPNIEFSADLNFVGKQAGWWIVEVVALIDNKGKVQHRMSEFEFDLNAIYSGEPVELSERWGNQVDFPNTIARGSFLPAKYKFFFIDPGVKAKYSYIARVPAQAQFVVLHCWFSYAGRGKMSHTAERTVRVPDSEARLTLGTQRPTAGPDSSSSTNL